MERDGHGGYPRMAELDRRQLSKIPGYRSIGPWGSWRASRRWRNALIPQRVAK
jgi:hypothetical protein